MSADELYRVATDNGFPYRVYSAQQDSGTISVPTAGRNVPLGLLDAYQVGGGEASHIAVDPRDANVVYATISGQVSRTDLHSAPHGMAAAHQAIDPETEQRGGNGPLQHVQGYDDADQPSQHHHHSDSRRMTQGERQ